MSPRTSGLVLLLVGACSAACGADYRADSYPPGASPEKIREMDRQRDAQRAAQQNALAQLPTPKVAPGELPRPCFAKSSDEYRSKLGKPFASPETEARWKERREPVWEQPGKLLLLWSVKHFGTSLAMQDAFCYDLPFALKKLQAAWGDPATGIVSDRDVDRLLAAAQAGRANFTQQNLNAAQATEARERDLLRIFGIALGAPLRLPSCEQIASSSSRPSSLPATCYATQGKAAERAAVYFSKDEQPAWLDYIHQWSWKTGYSQPISLMLDLRDWVVTGVHFETTTDHGDTAAQALTEKFRSSPTIARPEKGRCLNFYTGQIYDCNASTITTMTWDAKAHRVMGFCNAANFRCDFHIQLRDALEKDRARQQQQDEDKRRRDLESGRKL